MTATPMLRTPAPAPGIPPDPTPPPGAGADDHAAGTLAVASAALRGGFVLLPRTLLHAPGLSRDAKLLYAVLLSYAWQRGSCFPGYERLQHDLGCGVNQVTKYLRELEGAGLVTRRKRGQGKTTLYTLHDPPAPPTTNPLPPAPTDVPQTHQIGESGVTGSVSLDPPIRRHKQDSREKDPEEHQPAPDARARQPAPSAPPATLAPTDPPAQEPGSADDDDALLELLLSRGVTHRIAQELVRTHSRGAIEQQVAWQAYRQQAKSPAGALVQAIRDAWPPPPAWREAQAHMAAAARRAEEDRQQREAEAARRRAWAAKPPEERIAGRLQFWLLGQRAKRREPTAAEVAEKRAELLTQLPSAGPGGA